MCQYTRRSGVSRITPIHARYSAGPLLAAEQETNEGNFTEQQSILDGFSFDDLGDFTLGELPSDYNGLMEHVFTAGA